MPIQPQSHYTGNTLQATEQLPEKWSTKKLLFWIFSPVGVASISMFPAFLGTTGEAGGVVFLWLLAVVLGIISTFVLGVYFGTRSKGGGWAILGYCIVWFFAQCFLLFCGAFVGCILLLSSY